jgi:hypothetical protein
VTLICAALRAPRSSVYAVRVAPAPATGGKRGPKTGRTDEELLAAIRAVWAACPFHSEGHRKVHCRLRAQGIRVGRKRVLRLMGAHHRLVPSRPRHVHGDPAHGGTIITTRPDEMWGTDATRFSTEREGWCWCFGAVDHYTTEVMGWHVAQVDGLRVDRPAGRPRRRAAARLGQPVHGEHLRERDQVLGLHRHAGVRR